MKLHTKILIGMAVGAVVGLFLGPKSSLLEHDLYRVENGASVTLLLDKDDPTSRLALPKNVEIRMLALETEMGLPAAGADTELPKRVRVRFQFTKHMALADKDGVLQNVLRASRTAKTGKDTPVRPDNSFEAWLLIEHQEVDRGVFLAVPEPVSSIGDSIIGWVSPVGTLFMRLIKMVIAPLVFASLLVGIAGLGDVRKLGRLGTKTLALYLATTALAVTIGLTVASVVRPGGFVAKADSAALRAKFADAASERVESAAEAPSFVDNVLDIVPENPIEAMTNNSKMLQIIFFALLFGIALTMLKEQRSKQIITFFDTVQHAMIIIIHMVMAVAPFGVAALLAEAIGNSGLSILTSLLVYSATVLLGLFLHAALVYGGLVKFRAKLPLIPFLKAVRPAQLVAFSTSSSSATLPISLECAEENIGVSEPVSSFVLPLGSTVNMDGTALYQGVAAVFIAQVFGMDLSLGAQIGVVFAATAASIGAAGVPGAGMITLAMVLTTAGIPAAGIALILGVDRILDMFRTAVNVTGDLAVTSTIAASEGESLILLSSGEDAGDPARGFEGRLKKEAHAIAPDDTAD